MQYSNNDILILIFFNKSGHQEARVIFYWLHYSFHFLVQLKYSLRYSFDSNSLTQGICLNQSKQKKINLF